MVGGEDDDGVVDDALRQLVELFEDVTDLLIDDLSDLGVAVETALPVVEGSDAGADAEVSLAVWSDAEAGLKRVRSDASPDGRLKLLDEGVGGGFVECRVVVGVLPVGRKELVAEGGRGFELIDVPVDDRRSVGIVDDLRELSACGFVLVVVREEVGVGEEFSAGREELAVVRVDVADGQKPWGIVGLDVLQVVDGLVGGVGVVVELGGIVEVAVGALQVVSGGVGGTVPVESVGGSVAGAIGDGDMPLAEVGGFIAGCLKKLAVGRECRIQHRQVGIVENSGDEPALMGVEAGDDGAAGRCAGAGRGVVVGELYAALPDVFVQVRHEALEVFFGAVDAYREDGGPAQFVDKDEENVWFRSWFGDGFRETKAGGDTGACDGGGGFQKVSALHMYFLQWMKFVAAESELRRGPKPGWQPTQEITESLHNG